MGGRLRHIADLSGHPNCLGRFRAAVLERRRETESAERVEGGESERRDWGVCGGDRAKDGLEVSAHLDD